MVTMAPLQAMMHLLPPSETYHKRVEDVTDYIVTVRTSLEDSLYDRETRGDDLTKIIVQSSHFLARVSLLNSRKIQQCNVTY